MYVTEGHLSKATILGMIAMGVAVLASVFASAGSYESPTSYAAGLVPAVWTGAAIVAAGALVAVLLPGRSKV